MVENKVLNVEWKDKQEVKCLKLLQSAKKYQCWAALKKSLCKKQISLSLSLDLVAAPRAYMSFPSAEQEAAKAELRFLESSDSAQLISSCLCSQGKGKSEIVETDTWAKKFFFDQLAQLSSHIVNEWGGSDYLG